MARTLLDQRDSLSRYCITSSADVDMSKLDELMTDAWSLDYVDEVRIDLSAEHLGHMMEGDDWFAVLVCDKNDQPVGFEMAMARTLLCKGRQLRAFFVTAFTVSSHHRRQGIGRWVLEGINKVAFEQRGADLLFSAFHVGMAGSPTVQATFDDISNWRVARFHASANFGMRVDRDPPPSPALAMSVTRVVWPDCNATWEHKVENDDAGPLAIPDATEYTRMIAERYEVAFAPDAAFRTMYLLPDSDDGAMLWYGFENGARACVCYALMPLIVNERKLRPVGMIQTVHADNCTPEQTEALLLHLAHRFRELGCLAISLYDLGVIPMSIVEKLGLKPDQQFQYTVRGPSMNIEAVEDTSAPYLIDLT